jgi:ABC-2 type transport system permease protein
MIMWSVMYRKEILEMWRSFKWLWMPLIFILLGAMQPITTYYMPQILEFSGGLPEGTIIDIPVPTGGQMMASVLSQFGSIGVLALVLAGMGIVAAEKQNRSITLVMVRPVRYFNWILAKWSAFVTIGLVSLTAGAVSGWYYTEILIGDVIERRLISAVLVYGVWLIFVMSVTLLASTVLKSSSAAAFISILFIATITALTSLLGNMMQWSPAQLPMFTTSLLTSGEYGDNFALCLTAAIVIISFLLMLSARSIKKQEVED